MSKFFVSLLCILGLYVYLSAEQRVVPTAQTGEALQFSDYGGYEVSTRAFTTTTATAATAGSRGVAAYVVFSSGSTTEFVDLYFSSETMTLARTDARIYNVANSTDSTLGGQGMGRTPVGPMRFRNGLFWKASVATFNMINVLFDVAN